MKCVRKALYQGDCRQILPTLKCVDAIVSDPPYGIALDCDNRRFQSHLSKKPQGNRFRQIRGDEAPFDPTWLLNYPHVALFGYQFFADKLPVGGMLIWVKNRPEVYGKFLGDAELCWLKKPSKAVYVMSHIWRGCDRESERGKPTLHPTQKPIVVMKWIIEQMKLPEGTTICDPYMGSGSTGLAALAMGYNFIGIEQDEEYFEVARGRLSTLAA